jgi:hypothetical protein
MEFLPVNSEDATPTENMTYEDVAPLAFPGKYFDTNALHLVQAPSLTTIIIMLTK